MRINNTVLRSLAEGSSVAKEQLNEIQEAASSLEDNALEYITFFFYLTERLRLGCSVLEKRFSDKKAIELRAFIERKAKLDHEEASKGNENEK